MAKLFISHSSADLSLVDPFVDLLEEGVGIPSADIFCSSRKGQGIPTGSQFVEYIRSNLSDSSCVMAIISENYYGSPFCMCELGGVWFAAKSFLPVLVPPLQKKSLSGVLQGIQVLKIDAPDDLDQLCDELKERLGVKGKGTPRWNDRRNKFGRYLKKNLAKLPKSSSVSRETYVRVQGELKEYIEQAESDHEEMDRLKRIVKDLSKLKDKVKAAKVLKKHLPESEQFTSLVAECKAALWKLPSAAHEALYYDLRRQEYFPRDSDAWDDAHSAEEHGLVDIGGEGEGVTPNTHDKKVNKALRYLKKLQKWMEEPSSDFAEWYYAAYPVIQFDLTLRPFWDTHLT